VTLLVSIDLMALLEQMAISKDVVLPLLGLFIVVLLGGAHSSLVAR